MFQGILKTALICACMYHGQPIKASSTINNDITINGIVHKTDVYQDYISYNITGNYQDGEEFLIIRNASNYIANIVILQSDNQFDDINIYLNEQTQVLSFSETRIEDYNYFPTGNLLKQNNGETNAYFSVNDSVSMDYIITINKSVDTSQAVENAYNTGYNDGYSVGYPFGYETGLSEGQLGNDSYKWVTGIFDTLVNILNVELLPNLKLAYLIGIPFIITLVTFIIGWFR